MMALLTECHHGDGTAASHASNAELPNDGQEEFIIPTVYRNNYLAALGGFSNRNEGGKPLYSIHNFTQKWVSHVNWPSYETACSEIEKSNGFLDSVIGESTSRRLTIPED